MNSINTRKDDVESKIRNSTFDMMKGLAIILMVVGHRVSNIYVVHLIYSFHMPLFFLLAGFFYRSKSIKIAVINDFKRLLVPYFFVGFITIIAMLAFEQKFSVEGMIEGLQTLLWAKAYKHTSPIWGDLGNIGAIWFLFALFWTKTIFNVLNKFIQNIYWLGLLCLVFSASAVIIDHYIICLPFAILPGISALIFYFIGYYFHKIEAFTKVSKSRYLVFICLLLWVLGVVIGSINIGTCYYKNPAFSILGAISACLFWYWLLDKINIPVLVYFGSVSLVVLCVHKLITALQVRELLAIPFGWWQVIFDLTICAIMIPLMQKCGFFRNLFGLKEIENFKDCFRLKLPKK